MGYVALSWLPADPHWAAAIARLEAQSSVVYRDLTALANRKIDFLQTDRLDRLYCKHFKAQPPADLAAKPIRLAIIGSSTLTHLLPGLRVGALRRGLWLELYEGDYGLYYQDLIEPSSRLAAFRPDIVLLALDAAHVSTFTETEFVERLQQCWRAARDIHGATVIQQTVLPTLPALLGHNEHRLADSGAARVESLNSRLRAETLANDVHLLALDRRAAQDGLRAWHDPALWRRAKQDVSPGAAHVYGDLAARIVAALQGRSSKCLVLDLDNTLWGGVIGDDGLDGIVLGQGSEEGEAFAAVQRHALLLARRGVILAVCSKNDEATAVEPFEKHPDMVLRREHIASFIANWDDKATNIRRIAQALNIGLDSLVFVDDNPFERSLVREQLPEVSVPELPDEDPAAIPFILADAGYFESVTLTAEDRERTAQYRANEARTALEHRSVDLPAYLRSLDMQLAARPFDEIGLARIVQLINKTNQFNLRTQRATADRIRGIIDDPRAFGLQLRLLDRFGDNGIIAIVIGLIDAAGDCFIDTWLMSCRVLGRQVEQATLNLIVREARRLGARRLVGEYVATAKNGMVAEHYQRLGFTPLDGPRRLYGLDLLGFAEGEVLMQVRND